MKKNCLIIFGIYLIIAQSGATQTPLNNSWYNILYSKDCDIPNQAEIIHYPMVHPHSINLDYVFKYFFNRSESDESGINQEPTTVMMKSNSISENAQSETDYLSPAISTDEQSEQTIILAPNFTYINPVAYSSFQFIQLLKKYPSALVFDEMIWSPTFAKVVGRMGKWWNYTNKILWPLALVSNNLFGFQITMERLTNISSYNTLEFEERRILSKFTGGIIALLLGIIDRLYPSTLIEPVTVVEQHWKKYELIPNEAYPQLVDGINQLSHLSSQFKKANKEEQKEIKNKFYKLYNKLKNLRRINMDFLFQYRESLLFDSVRSTLTHQIDHQTDPVIVAYGMAHDFSDEFSNYNFYTIPYSCSLPEGYTSDLNIYVSIIRHYIQETNEENKDVIYEFLQEKWIQMSESERNRLKRSSLNQFLISDFEQLRRIFNKESFSEEENFEFIFHSFVSGEVNELLPHAIAVDNMIDRIICQSIQCGK